MPDTFAMSTYFSSKNRMILQKSNFVSAQIAQ